MNKFLLIFFIIVNAVFANEAYIIGIAGGSASGKTTLAKKIFEAFPDDAILISQDSYYKDLSEIPMEKRYDQNFDHPNAIEFSLLEKNLKSLKIFQQIQVPIYDFITCTRSKKTTTVYPKKIIIVEGILVLAIPEVRNLFDVKIYVDTPDDVRILRRIERDIVERGRTFESVKKQYLATVAPMHREFVEPSKYFADLIVPEGGYNRVVVEMIQASIDKVLEK